MLLSCFHGERPRPGPRGGGGDSCIPDQKQFAFFYVRLKLRTDYIDWQSTTRIEGNEKGQASWSSQESLFWSRKVFFFCPRKTWNGRQGNLIPLHWSMWATFLRKKHSLPPAPPLWRWKLNSWVLKGLANCARFLQRNWDTTTDAILPSCGLLGNHFHMVQYSVMNHDKSQQNTHQTSSYPIAAQITKSLVASFKWTDLLWHKLSRAPKCATGV